MSIFQDLGTDQDVRKQLFYLVCIWIRFLIATVFVLATLLLDSWAAYLVGAIEILGGLGFGIKRIQNRKNHKRIQNTEDHNDYSTTWWYRGAHSLFWLSGGIATIVLRHKRNAESAAGATGAFLFFDVIFGIGTALLADPGWKKDIESKMLSPRSMKWFALTEGDGPAVFTLWTLAHIVLTSLLGAVSYFIWPSRPWVACIASSFIVFLWEAAENAFPDKVKFMFKEGGRKPDSWVNQLSDTVVGLICIWTVAYILHATL